jgi:glycosyltransferase involved in cell wall biosynthesis
VDASRRASFRAVLTVAVDATPLAGERTGIGRAVRGLVPGDPDALAGALGRVLDDSSLRAQLTDKAKSRVERFTWDAAGRAMRSLYAEIASSR